MNTPPVSYGQAVFAYDTSQCYCLYMEEEKVAQEEQPKPATPETKEGSWWTIVLIVIILALLVEGAYVTLTNRVHQEPLRSVTKKQRSVVPSE
jgi:hypothetical protein